ncbi:unnamed protein product [Rhizopus stolonifer]
MILMAKGPVKLKWYLCIFYGREYTKENVEKYLKRIEEMEEVGICYTTNPRRPFLQCTNRIHGTPDEYRLYVSNNEKEVEASKDITFVSGAQVVDFINSAYRPSDELYLLSVLNTKYHDNVANHIQNILPQHKAQISNLKEDGLNIVGYCRKSGLNKQGNIINLLQRMVDNHYQRSLVDKVFVSPCSNASSSFPERDLSDQSEVFSQLKSVHGNTKGKLILAIV